MKRSTVDAASNIAILTADLLSAIYKGDLKSLLSAFEAHKKRAIEDNAKRLFNTFTPQEINALNAHLANNSHHYAVLFDIIFLEKLSKRIDVYAALLKNSNAFDDFDELIVGIEIVQRCFPADFEFMINHQGRYNKDNWHRYSAEETTKYLEIENRLNHVGILYNGLVGKFSFAAEGFFSHYHISNIGQKIIASIVKAQGARS